MTLLAMGRAVATAIMVAEALKHCVPDLHQVGVLPIVFCKRLMNNKKLAARAGPVPVGMGLAALRGLTVAVLYAGNHNLYAVSRRRGEGQQEP